MNDEFDRLEAELAALLPQPPSGQLQARIAERLQRQAEPPVNTEMHAAQPARSAFGHDFRGSNSSGGPRGARLAVAAASLAVLAVALWLLPHGGRRWPVAEPPAPATAPVATAFDDALPSLWQYQRALARPEDELDAMLDRHAGQARSEPPQYVQIRGFGRFDRELNDLLGEI